ncbi:MAG TPA: translocation/assembly module TamB domain-containing protein [Candidatus Sulfotelmatobacter sp.]|jgi:translocation and assembly module TamB|nr:translocation/assembly module TamB domain-containing protein [Candidatus Sulfotelmatobacter sp.]
MTEETRRKKILWLEHLFWVLGTWTLLGVALAIIALGSGLANPLLRRFLVNRLHNLTGTPVEVRTVSVGWFSLTATVNGLVIHGTEPPSTDPLFRAEQARIGLRIDSFWGRRVSLNDLLLVQPRVHLRVEKNGSSNLPVIKKSDSRQPLQQTLLALHIRHIEIRDGWFLYNNLRSLVATEGGDLRLNVTVGGTPDHPLYLGSLDWDSIQLARRRDLPLPANLSARFSASREAFTLEQAVVDVGRSHLDLQAETKNFETPNWTYRYRGWLDLLDIREAFRTPEVPLGRIDLRGDGTLASGQFGGKGEFAADNIVLSFEDFHSANLTSRSHYALEPDGVVLPDFAAYGLGGSVKGPITMKYDGLKFRAVTKVQGIRLSGVAPAIDHAGFPIDSLHWDSVIYADTVETWHDNFRDFDISASMRWEEPDETMRGHVPVTSEAVLRYRYTPNTLELKQFDFETPTSRGSFTGILHPKQTSLDVRLDIGSLAPWDDFIHAISGDKPGTAAAKVPIDGALRWNGRILGPSDGPTFQGHFQGEHARYDNFALDSLDGDVTYSPTELVIARAHARRGTMAAGIDGQLQLTDWEFRPENQWGSELNLEKVPLESLEQLVGKKYPVQGLLTGQFHGRGTRAEPSLTGLVDLADATVYTVPFNRLRGQLTVLPDEVRLSNAELRFFGPAAEKAGGAGIVTGSVAYRYADESLTTDLVGASLPLANFGQIKASGLPLDGQMSFRLKSSGPIRAPLAEGSFRVVDLQVGTEVIGSFGGDLESDGKLAQLKLNSAMSEGAITGGITLGLGDPQPLDGKISVRNINLDPFLLSALHLGKFKGHGVADGEITFQGQLQRPETLTLDGNFSRVVFNYGSVQLENQGPIHLTSTKDSLKILSLALKGSETNAELTGSVQFTGRRTVAMKLNGSVDLRLLSGYITDVDVNGHADINTSFEGTLDRPRIIGRVKLNSISVRSADFPTGLSNLKGDLVFDANRLFFDNVTGEAGGGLITLAGTANYSEKPFRYDISAKTDRIRIRYPEGMSWLVGGGLRLSGTLDGGLLSGKVQVQRVTLNQGIEAVGSLTSSSSSSSTTSDFLRNLQLDVEGSSTPDTRLEWPGAHLEAESSLRVRGTAEHPILLGHIHVLSGDLYFHDNRYRVTRGDLNFANPFRMDPVINFEATTNVQQYEITLNFTGQASKMSLSYRSDPPLPGNDIVTLLALGQTSSETAMHGGATGQAGSSNNSGATALLSEAISSQLGGRVERLFGITRFRVDPGLASFGTTNANQNVGARVTVEQQVTRDLTVTYVSNVSSSQQQVIQVEYNLNRNISVVGLRDQNGTFGVDIKFKKRFQ